MTQGSWRRSSLLPTRADLALAGALAALAVGETAARSYEPIPENVALALLTTVPLAWRRRFPGGALVLVLGVLLAAQVAGVVLADPAYLMAVLLVGFYSVGAHASRRRAPVFLAAGLAFLAGAVAIEEGRHAGDFLFLAIVLGAAFALATALRGRDLRAAALEDRAAALEREREEEARRAVAEERARISRELHDVVAHSVSMIVVQTGAVRRRLRHERPREAEELEAVETAARQALAEMRRLLGVLRVGDDAPALAPQPGLAQADRLVEQVRAAGVDAELRVEGEAVALAPGVDLAAYRVLQEALTNVLKHTANARATVTIRYEPTVLAIEVVDDGERRAGGNGGGHGLLGMRERVGLYGGSLEHGARGDRGYAVRARLPLEDAS